MANRWNYVYFRAYLKLKPSTEYTGLESYIASILEQQRAKNRATWLPLERALMLEKPRHLRSVADRTRYNDDDPRHQRQTLGQKRTRPTQHSVWI